MGRLWVLILAGAWCLEVVHGTSCDELNARWRSRYHGDFHVEWPIERFQCDTEPSYFLAKALNDLYDVDSRHAFYDSAKSYTARTRRASCSPGVGAWMGQRSGTLTLCPPFFAANFAGEKRPATIFHEAAHARRSDPPHVRCDHGDVEGQLGCDQEFTENYDGGGYNWEVQYVAHARRAATDDISRWVLEAHLGHLLNDRFNRITLDQKRRWSR